MEQYSITGMSCAACSARVEKAVSSVSGVTSCSVSLLTNSMGVEGTASSDEIISAVEKAGYGAAKKQNENSMDEQKKTDELKDTQTPFLLKRLIASLVFLVVLMYFSMGVSMFAAPLPDFFEGNHIAVGLVQMILSAAVMIINQRFFINGFKGLVHRSPNMDTLVALGSFASFGWSVYVLFTMTNGKTAHAQHLYFESAAMILTLITVGKILESHSKGKTTDALKSLMKLSPETAVLLIDGNETKVPVSRVKKGDIFVVRAGENIPVDGIIVSGEAALDEKHLTGESIPVDKKTGDSVYCASVNLTGYIECKAERVGEDTSLSKIIKMVSDAAATKAPIAKIADRVSGVFVPVVMGISLITLLVWLVIGKSVSFSLARAISVLVISCPCALGLATPVAIMVSNGLAAKNGILFKTASSLEQTGKIKIAVLDKTGTVTKGEPKVTDVLVANGTDENRFLSTVYSLEELSEHPLAKATALYCREHAAGKREVTGFINKSGFGVEGIIDGKKITGTSLSNAEKLVGIDDKIKEKCREFAGSGKTPLVFISEKSVQGVIAVADTIKEDSPRAVEELKNMGIKVVMLTGDNKLTAEAIGRQVKVDKVIAGVFPEGKEKVIARLKGKGAVMMVGDGINDAPALTRADIGVAIGTGADVAVDAADVVLINGSLLDVAAAVRLSRQTLRNIKQNLFWAFFYNALGIPLAAGVFINLFGWELNPMFGAAAMSLSSFFVVSNALRLNLFRLKNPGRDKKIKSVELDFDEVNTQTEEEKMKKEMKIEGMMCAHCEATVKKALESLEGVDKAVVSHENGTAVLTLSAEVDASVLKNAVEEKDFKVIDIK